MTPEQKQTIILSQRNALRRNGFHPNALFWSNKEVQELRFQILSNIGIQANSSLLDVGCGFGDFAGFLFKKGISVQYTGIDISADLLEEGRRQYPTLKLIESDLLEYRVQAETYDYVVLSGVLNRMFINSQDLKQGAKSSRNYALKVIIRMFETCKKGIAFNLLDARHQWTAGRWDLQSFHPDEITQLLSQYTKKYQLIDNYLDNDFTIYAWRE